MKIAFVHNKWFPYTDEKPYKRSAGGAALTNIAIIREGELRGHKIDLVFAWNNETGNKPNYLQYPIEKVDLVILSHIPKFSETKFINKIMQKCKYVRWDHAYDFCTLGVANMCKVRCFENKCEKCRINYNRELHQNSILSVFQSPLHKEVHEKILGAKFDNSFILPPPIDTDLFSMNDLTKEKNNTIVIIGSIMKHKGIENVMKYIDENPENNYIFIGGCKDETYLKNLKQRKNVILKGHLNNYLLPEYYEKAFSYIHLPLWWEPSSRSTLEAYLMNCKLIINDKVGTMSFDFMKNIEWMTKKDIVQIIKDAPKKFWEEIEKRMK